MVVVQVGRGGGGRVGGSRVVVVWVGRGGGGRVGCGRVGVVGWV